MPRIIGQDSDIVRRMFLEATQAVGCTAVFYGLKERYTKDLYNDPDAVYNEPITLEVLFDENPKVKLMKDYGWYNEDEEIRPLLIYLPIYKNQKKELLDVMENALIEIVYFGVNKRSQFRISSKRLDSLYGNYWICKCVPERKIVFTKDASDGFDYLDVNREVTSADESTIIDTSTPNLETQDIGYVEDISTQGINTEDTTAFTDFYNNTEVPNNDTANSDDYSSLVME